MKRILSLIVFLTIAIPALSSIARAQESPFPIDVAVTYTAERTKIASINCGCFWLQGGSANAAVTLFHGLGVAVNVSGGHASDIVPGIDLSKISFMAGPRYTLKTHRWTGRFLGEKHTTSLFGEALFGVAHGFDSVFPTSSGSQNSANAFSTQIGGGANITLLHGFGLRLLEIDYVRTQLPNGASNTQNDLRLAFGLSYQIHGRE
jgi:hypothetical protein